MYNPILHQQVNAVLQKRKIDIAGKDNGFYTRMIANAAAIAELYNDIYGNHATGKTSFVQLLELIARSHQNRSAALKANDDNKAQKGVWFLSNELAGMSLYVDRFCGNLKTLAKKLDHFNNLGVNLLHLLPVFESPAGESDGGYAVSDFRKVDKRFGSLADLQALQQKMRADDMYQMLDIVLNHTSHKHEWAMKAKNGDATYQDYFYMFDDRTVPDEYERWMPEIFPESSPGNFTYIPECNKWVMSVFHSYQWDLNFTNPAVFIAMLDNIFFYANLGVDVLRIDAPAFIWKQLGTSCQNLPQAHTLLRLIKLCVEVASPGMAILGEAIVSPTEIMKYFGSGQYTAKECDFAYNATQMALQWDMLATGDSRVMLNAQPELLQKPLGATWLTYTRCHDDIGLGYDDEMIRRAGYDPYLHRQYLKEYYSGNYAGSPAKGALFSFNPKTGDARISGSLASLCGLETALANNDVMGIDYAIRKILLMQAHSFFIGGVPMLFYGDELGYCNDYSYLNDPGKSYDNRWMHRPVIDWKKNKKIEEPGTIEFKVFTGTKKLLALRKKLKVVSDLKNITWMLPYNIHVAGYLRADENTQLFCVFNFSSQPAYLSWQAFKQLGTSSGTLFDHHHEDEFGVGNDEDYLVIEPYGFHLLEPVSHK